MSENPIPPEKLTLFKHNSVKSLPHVEVPEPYVRLFKDGEQQVESGIKKASPFLADVKTMHVEDPIEEAYIARETAITFDHVTILPLVGMNISMLDEEKVPTWEFEPHPDFEKEVKNRYVYITALDNARKANKGNLWNSLQEVASEVTAKTGKEIDMKNLTPYQATYLIYELITKRMNYEYLILPPGERDQHLPRVENGEFPTSRPDLIPLAAADPKKFQKEAKRLESKIDSLSSDKLIEKGFGVCRHIAATASVLYETLKERQEGLLMNGSYLLYHDEKVGEELYFGVEENHAYNLLVVTNPPAGLDTQPKVAVSIVEPTWVIEEKNDEYYDQTWKRLSQAPSFIKEFGIALGLKNPEMQSVGLADEVVTRLRKYIYNTSLSKKLGVSNLINDFSAALSLSSCRDRGQSVVGVVVDLLERKGITTSFALIDIFDIPVFSKEVDGKRIIKKESLREFAQAVSAIDFSDPDFSAINELLLTNIENTIATIPLQKQKEYHLLLDGFPEFCSQYMRACIETSSIVSPEIAKKIDHLIAVGKKYGLRVISDSLIYKFRQLNTPKPS